MKPELLENTVFLRYYERWQKDPTSVVFAAISEIFRENGMIEESVSVAIEGLKYHPNLITGRLALAKAYIAKGEGILAKKEAETVLHLMPNNQEAKTIISGKDPSEIFRPVEPVTVQTITEVTPVSVGSVEDFEEEEITISEGVPIEMVDDEANIQTPYDCEAWNTITMAKILESQGHFARARRIYRAILERDPNNKTAIEELAAHISNNGNNK